MSRLTIAGIGPGNPGYMIPEIIRRMKNAHTVIAAKRILPMLREQCGQTETDFIPMGKIKETFDRIDDLLRE